MTPAERQIVALAPARSAGIWIVPVQPLWRRALVALRLLPPPSMQMIPFEIDIETGRLVADIPEGTKIVRV